MQIAERFFPNATEVIEPAVGDGAFVPSIKAFCNKRNIPYAFYDLSPDHPEGIQMDFKELKLRYKPGRIMISNPPFGNASSLFKRFVKGACEMGDGAVYVGPASHWNAKWGWKGLRLVYSEHLGDVEYYTSEGNGESKRVNTCLNVYMRGEEESDDRMERLERDVEIGNVRRRDWGESSSLSKEWDFFIGRDGIKEIPDEGGFTFISLRVLNKKYYNEVKDFCEGFPKKHSLEIKKMESGNPYLLKVGWLKEKLAEWLYPTREERLDRDVEIKFQQYKDWNIEGDFYLRHFSGGDGMSAGQFDPDRKYCKQTILKVLNEDRRDDIKGFCIRFNEKYAGDIKKMSSGQPAITKDFFKQKLAEWLYPEDEYE